jgi:AcrR family transcriptional regulator
VRVKTDEKRQEIVTVAREVFREKGYAVASMAEISGRLGGSKGTLYSYFTSKEELFVAVMLEMSQRSAASMLSELEQAADMKAVLPKFMNTLITLLCSEELVDFRRMLISEAGRSRIGKVAYEQGPRRYMEKFADLFAAQMRLGHFRNVDPRQASIHMQSLCMGGPVQWVLEGVIDRPSNEEIATAAQAAADVFLRAYALEPPAARRLRKSTKHKRRSRAAV